MAMVKLDGSGNVWEQNLVHRMQARSEACPALGSCQRGNWWGAHEGGMSKVTRFPLSRKLLKHGVESNVRWRIDERRETRVLTCLMNDRLKHDGRSKGDHDKTPEQGTRWRLGGGEEISNPAVDFLPQKSEVTLVVAAVDADKILMWYGSGRRLGRGRLNGHGRNIGNYGLEEIRR